MSQGTQGNRTLARVPLFQGLQADAVRQIDTACTWRHVAAKEWVVDHEDVGTEVFFVLRGHVRVIVSVAGKETILRDIQDGEFFGELAAIDLRPRSARIIAITDSTLARMSAETFRRAIHAHPTVCDQVLAVLVGQVRMLANRANEAAGLRMKHRLWAELLRLARPGPNSSGMPIVSPPPTHAELAGRVNSHREAVTRELNASERAGLIARRRGAIVLLDADRLRQMVTEAAEQ